MGKKESLGKLCLLVLEKTVDGCVGLEDMISHAYVYSYGYDRPLKKSAFAQALKRLREKGFIDADKNEEKIIYKLTEAGKDFLLTTKPEDQIEWDGKWRIVTFDIPENKKSVRNILRYRLKMWGFVPWQKSVWASKKNITQKLRGLVKELGVEDWVLVFESEVGR